MALRPIITIVAIALPSSCAVRMQQTQQEPLQHKHVQTKKMQRYQKIYKLIATFRLPFRKSCPAGRPAVTPPVTLQTKNVSEFEKYFSDFKNSFTKTYLEHHKICSRHISQVLLPNFLCRIHFWEKRNSKFRIDFFHFLSKKIKNFILKTNKSDQNENSTKKVNKIDKNWLQVV